MQPSAGGAKGLIQKGDEGSGRCSACGAPSGNQGKTKIGRQVKAVKPIREHWSLNFAYHQKARIWGEGFFWGSQLSR